ncbi:hypothetical protein GL50803_009707 [Giardia duodenalis]|uniref:Uncharacterized protein n=1 Tax=Giardia intestinalis (strain ATCC 50803 / WB clone C6) TaxID=184922 RepID=A8BVE2_GIAIC|nr:hypothetical protein GL50803_009707 [Giardia intestinalis]KAE8302684.1 hypothetical protein GL50803_009707 [Giardia intestinalis]|eukprot:XP_001704618.1 Hypothetical protein GL50803_9707 [Giardia lamblia ATCC 50803]
MIEAKDDVRAEVLMYDEFEEFGVLQDPEKALTEAILSKDTWQEAWNKEPTDAYIQMLQRLE